jgi:glutathione S-transferase
MFGMKAHIAALEKGLDVDLVMVSFSDERGYDPKHPEALRINPKVRSISRILFASWDCRTR